MEITEVRIKLVDEPGERLKAFCSITFDDWFVVRDLKIIEGATGPFVAMPSRKLTSHCYKCGSKNHLRAAYCNQCGVKLPEGRTVKDADGRAKLYADIAHPINSACREMIQQHVVEEYEAELDRAQEPGYVSRYDDYDLPESPADRQRRIDQAHTSNQTSRPHHPPHGDISRTGSSGGPSADPGHTTRDSDGSFGAGIW
ncbi:MAG: SpoVG family protein [Planctomycetota bacterium]